MKLVYVLLAWAITALGAFILAHVVDREGLAGALLESSFDVTTLLAFVALMVLRGLTLLILPPVVFALAAEALVLRLVGRAGRRSPPVSPGAETSSIETSQIGN